MTDVIVACGGGTPCRQGAMELMNQSGTTVFLQPSHQRLIRRLMDGRGSRPKLAAISTEEEMERFARTMIAERMPFYGKSRLSIDSSFLETPEEIERTVRMCGKLLNL